MHRLFMPLDEEVSCRLTETGKMVLDIAHLIDRKCVERYQNKFATTSAMMRDCQMQLSGPWPPYHFVHRLTRGAHIPAQPTAAEPVTAVAASRRPSQWQRWSNTRSFNQKARLRPGFLLASKNCQERLITTKPSQSKRPHQVPLVRAPLCCSDFLKFDSYAATSTSALSAAIAERNLPGSHRDASPSG